MDTNPQPPDDYALDHLLGRARIFIAELTAFIETALRRLPEYPSRRALGYITRRALIPAETALRRAILLIASTLETPAPKAAPGKASGPPGPPLQKGASAARAPVFRMSEPQPRPPRDTGAAPKAACLPEALLPRILALTDDILFAPPAPVKPAPPPRDTAFGFLRRLDALRRAYDDPVREARRWLRRKAAPGSLPLPISSGKIPGARRSLGEAALSLLRELTDAAQRSLALNTS